MLFEPFFQAMRVKEMFAVCHLHVAGIRYQFQANDAIFIDVVFLLALLLESQIVGGMRLKLYLLLEYLFKLHCWKI